MKGMRSLAAGLGVAALIVIGAACGDGERPASTDKDTPVARLAAGASGDTLAGSVPSAVQTQTNPAVSAGMMVPRAGSAEELISRSHVIVLGTIGPDPVERRIGPYGEDGKPLPADDEGGNPFTDYLVQIEDVLKADDSVADSDTLVLRMFGHLSDRDSVITPNVFTLPNPGDRLLLALGLNPDGTVWVGSRGSPGHRWRDCGVRRWRPVCDTGIARSAHSRDQGRGSRSNDEYTNNGEER